ncbi:MAG: hypothetical protein IKI44_08435 [Bacteroidaceae bacterium]|nr:hypothetical protein [Bacteroidaceae bacterium]MBR7052992.1 hypothetical protein [Bacteroidaceae bacterium]
MDKTKPIIIEFSKGTVLTDVSSNLAALARTIELSAESDDVKTKDASAIRTLAGYINSPSDNVIRPIVARAFTEAYDRIKTVSQRYLIVGRTEDDNRLESIINGERITVFNGSIPSPTPSNITSFALRAGEKYRITMTAESGEPEVTISYGDRQYGLTKAVSVEITGLLGAEDAVVNGRGPAAEVEIVADSTEYAVIPLELAMPGNFNIAMTSAIKSAAHKIFVDYLLSQVLRFQRPNDAAEALKSVELSERALLRALTARNTFARSHHDWI